MEPGVLNAVRIHAELQSWGYRGGLTVLRDLMRPHRPTHRTWATPRYETPPGQQTQLDLFHSDYLEGTAIRRLYYLALVLSHSRYAYGEFLPQLNKLAPLKALRRGWSCWRACQRNRQHLGPGPPRPSRSQYW